jgi:hypothetical protein
MSEISTDIQPVDEGSVPIAPVYYSVHVIAHWENMNSMPVVKISLLLLSLVVLLMHLFLNISMKDTIFLFVTYGCLLTFIGYISSAYINKLI